MDNMDDNTSSYDMVENMAELTPNKNSNNNNKVCFKVHDGSVLYFPKDKLIEHSEYFRALFTSSFSEADKDYVEVQESPLETVMIVGLFLIQNDLNVPKFLSEEFKNLYALNDLWKITAITNALLEEIDENDNNFSFYDYGLFLFEFALKYKTLRDKVVTAIARNLSEYRTSDGFYKLLDRKKEFEEWDDLFTEILYKERDINKEDIDIDRYRY